jgi:hypothetical protein
MSFQISRIRPVAHGSIDDVPGSIQQRARDRRTERRRLLRALYSRDPSPKPQTAKFLGMNSRTVKFGRMVTTGARTTQPSNEG